MSYILDALKKSEQERQENQAPTVHSVYPGSRFSKEKSSTPWLMIVLLISIISGLIVSGFWWYSRSSQIASTKEIPTNSQIKENSSHQNENNNAVVDVKPVNPVAPFSEKSIPESGLQESPIAKNTSVTIGSEVSADQVEQDLLPIMQVVELPDDVRSSMPPMAYLFHVYSSDKNKCTIIINNRRYREGELIGSGWLLDSITETGIVVRKDRFRAAIQVVDNW